MTLVIACAALAIAAVLYVFWVTPEPVRQKTASEKEVEFLAERKESIFEGLRDLQMEYRMGKLSDEDYQQIKLAFQDQLAGLHEEAEKLEQTAPVAEAAPIPGRCLRCGKDNPVSNSFCGTCGAPLSAEGGAPA